MVVSILMNFLYPPPASVVVTVLSVVSLASLSNAGWMEAKGKHMPYSKFWKVGNSNEKEKPKVPSKIGMIVFYTPALLAGVASFFLLPGGSLRFNLLRSAVTGHFLKRVLEVLFVHKYSGSMEVEAMITTTVSYFSSSATMIYNQYLMESLPQPAIDLKYAGISLLVVGLIGNFYHHILLAKLRSEGDNKYKIPHGGLFSLVICPHYLFEIIGFVGICCISQTVYPICFTTGTIFYLMGRSQSTLKWYQSKFNEFPRNVKALIPFVF